VPQRIEVAHGFSVREVVAMGRAPHLRGWLFATPSDEDIVDKTLASCDLAELADRAIETLSGGEQQRVHIARALAQRAPVLLLDEAAAHLDIRQVAGCYQLVRRLVRETELTCLAAMHDLSTAARHADNAVLLHDGKVIASGPIEAVMTDDHLSEAFGVGITSVSTTEGHRLFSC
jgi:iron complex transport system ATP-binding protein